MTEDTYPHARTVENLNLSDFDPEDQETVESLQSMYVMGIQNPDSHENVVYSVWYRPHNDPNETSDTHKEYQVLTSPSLQTGFLSANPDFGTNETIELSPEFFRAIRWCYHSMASMTPTTYFNPMDYTHHDSSFVSDLNSAYGGDEKYPEYEAWAISEIIPYLFSADDAPEEYRPLGEWISELTKYPVPALGIDDNFDDE